MTRNIALVPVLLPAKEQGWFLLSLAEDGTLRHDRLFEVEAAGEGEAEPQAPVLYGDAEIESPDSERQGRQGQRTTVKVPFRA